MYVNIVLLFTFPGSKRMNYTVFAVTSKLCAPLTKTTKMPLFIL